MNIAYIIYYDEEAKKNSGFIDMYTSSGKTVKMTIEKNIKIPAYRSQNNLMQFRYAKEAE